MWPSPSLLADVTDAICQGLLAGATAVALMFPASVNSGPESDLNRRGMPGTGRMQTVAPSARFADFGDFLPSSEARHVADWVADSADNAGADFILIDKKYARVLVFDAQARLRATSAVLLGGAQGDDTVPGIGSRPLDQVRPEERTTPAGRFVGERGHNARGEDVVWVDYDAAVSMHRVLATHPKERRLERLASESVQDRRISWGCINVPVAFFEAHISPLFAAHRAIIYVLPEVKVPAEVFGSYDVRSKHAVAAASWHWPSAAVGNPRSQANTPFNATSTRRSTS